MYAVFVIKESDFLTKKEQQQKNVSLKRLYEIKNWKKNLDDYDKIK